MRHMSLPSDAGISRYFEYLAAGLGSGNDVKRWTEPYEDSGGLGKMVSVARPVYSTFTPEGSSTSHTQLVGVVGTDVLMSTLEKYTDSASVVSALIERSRTCPAFDINGCALQQLRLRRQSQNCNSDSSVLTGGSCSVCATAEVDVSGLCSSGFVVSRSPIVWIAHLT